MKQSYSGKHDYHFGQSMLALRTAIRLTQMGLAQRLGVSRRAVGDWETGLSYPKAEHLKRLIELGVEQQAFSAGQEIEEIQALWNASHQKVLLDQQWLSTLFRRTPSPSLPLLLPPDQETKQPERPVAQPVPGTRVVWGEALAVPAFYGREEELANLTQWIVQEHCRVVGVLGMGGIGKTTLAVNLMHRVVAHFEVVIFRSLRNAPPCEVLLDDLLQTLAPESLRSVPEDLERRISLLLASLRTVRTLVVLDNLEAILEEGEIAGRPRAGFEGYERLLSRVAETAHQSSLLLTSREKPATFRLQEGRCSLIRSLHLGALTAAACKQLLTEKAIVGSPQEQAHLTQLYVGNPLALRIVAQTILELFEGEIAPFLQLRAVIFGGVRELLAEQYARLSSVEQTVLLWLAILREPVTLEELHSVLAVPILGKKVFEAVDSLRQRSLIEPGQRQGHFTLQSMVLEYLTEELIREATSELQQGQLHRLIEHGLLQAQAKDYVRQTQIRLFLAPILARVQSTYQEQAEMEGLFLALLGRLQGWADYAQGYGPANLVALLRLHRGHLRQVDLSHLTIRGAYLQGVEMQDTSLAGATLRDTFFTETLHATWSVAISRDGYYWAAGNRCGEVRVWREGGQTLHLLWQAHTDNTYTLAFSPDGQTLGTGSWDGMVKLWNVQSGTLLWTGEHTDLIRCVSFAPDGNLLASAGNDAVVRLWEVTSGRNVQVLQQPGTVFSLSWSPDGHGLACGSQDGSIRLWRWHGIQPASCTAQMKGHTSWVMALAFAPDGTRLVSASWDGTVRLWDVDSKQAYQTLTERSQRAYTVGWSPDGQTIACVGSDETIWLWDVAQGCYRAALRGHMAVVYSLAFTPDSRGLLSGSEDGSIRVWNVTRGQCERCIEGYAVSLYDVSWSPDGKLLASANSDMLVTLWDLADPERPRSLCGHNWTVHGVTWSPDGKFLVSSGRDNTLRLWHLATGTCLQILQDPDHSDTIFCIADWSPDGSLLACGSYRRGVHVWEMKTRTLLWVGRLQQTRIRHVAWSPDGTRLASGGDDGSVCLWSTDGTLLKRLEGHRGGVMCVAWSPDGRYLATGGGRREGGELLLWDVQRGECLRTYVGHGSSVFALTWSENGKMLVSGDSVGRLRWWVAESGKCVREREGHRGTVEALKVRPQQGKLLASGGDDGAIRIWDLDSGKHLQTLRRDRPYERLNITGIRGVPEAQKITLRTLGAFEDTDVDSY